MIRPRILAFGLAVVLGAIVCPCLLTPAHAETIDFLCATTSQAPKDLNVSIDLTASTAASWIVTVARSSVEAFPATITADKVTWVSRWKENVNHFTLIRTTGALILTRDGDSQTYSWACQKKP